jgi:hypothetical protein
MHDYLYGAAALVGWIALAYKLVHLRRDPHNAALRTICAAFACSAMAFTLVVGPIYAPIDAFLGVPNLAKLFVHTSMVVFGVCALRLLMLWQFPTAEARRRGRPVTALGGAVVAVMVTLILVAPIHDTSTIHFWKSHAGQTLMSWYLALFLVALTITFGAIAYRSWRFAGHVGRLPWLQRGLRVTAVGAVVSLGYCLCRGTFLVGLQFDATFDPLVDLAIPFASIGQIIFFAGLTMPSWGSRITALNVRIEQGRAYRALYPLWSALYEAFPDIALHTSDDHPGADPAVGDLDYRLYRRMVEIWDGQLALRPYLPAELTAAANPTDLPERADAEARDILEALQVRQLGHPAGHPTGSADVGAEGRSTNELEWLVSLSQAFARAPRQAVPAASEQAPA